jgi:CheY-like chemotaxis protein
LHLLARQKRRGYTCLKEEAETTKTAMTPDANVEILIVEDDPMAATLAQEILNAAGYRTMVLNDTLQVISTVRAQKPRLVLMDLLMPGIDGMTLIKKIKQDPLTRSTRLIVVSGKAMQSEQYRASTLGVDYFISKPYDVSAFAQIIGRIIGPPSNPPR